MIAHLDSGFSIHQYGLGTYEAPGDWPCPLLPAAPFEHPRSVAGIRRLATGFRPDVMLVAADALYADVYGELATELGIPACLYTPVDYPLRIELGSLQRLRCFQGVVSFTQFGATVLQRVIWGNDASTHQPIGIVPHGVDLTTFSHRGFEGQPGRTRARQALFHRCDLDDAFIVLNANKHDLRKNIPTTLNAFALFARDKPANVLLYLHMAPDGVDGNIHRLAAELGITSRIMAPEAGSMHPTVDDARLNLIYNACDVGVNTARGEGWGLISFEHGASGAPQIVPDHTGPGELWRDHGLLAEVAREDHDDVFTYASVSAQSVAAHLEILYRNPDVYHHYSQLAQQSAARREYRWAKIGARLSNILFDLLHD